MAFFDEQHKGQQGQQGQQGLQGQDSLIKLDFIDPLCYFLRNFGDQMSKIVITVLLSLVLSACSTSYQEYQGGLFASNTGFSDYQIDCNTFSISFRANEYTKGTSLNAFVLKRAAEVTLEHDFQYFVILYTTDQTQVYTTSSYNPFCSTTLHEYPGITMHIRCYQDNPPQDAHNAASFIGV